MPRSVIDTSRRIRIIARPGPAVRRRVQFFFARAADPVTIHYLPPFPRCIHVSDQPRAAMIDNFMECHEGSGGAYQAPVSALAD